MDAFIKIAESEEALGGTFNVGSNFEISILELVNKVLGLMGKEATILEEGLRLRPEASEVRRLWADSALAAETFAWKPRASMEEGLRLTIDWISKHLDRSRTKSYVT